MKKNIKSIIIYIIVAMVVIAGYIGYNKYKEKVLLKTMSTTLQKYFKSNNTHISSHDFSISDVKIICKGNDAYVVEFNLALNDNTTNKLNKLGATLYKNSNTWYVKGFGKGLTENELNLYKLKCYK